MAAISLTIAGTIVALMIVFLLLLPVIFVVLVAAIGLRFVFLLGRLCASVQLKRSLLYFSMTKTDVSCVYVCYLVVRGAVSSESIQAWEMESTHTGSNDRGAEVEVL